MRFVSVALLPILLSACGLDDFEHVITDEATIPGTVSTSGPFTLAYAGGFNDLDLSGSKSFDNAGVEPGDVDAIYLKSVHLEGTNPSVDRLSVILESVTLWVEAPNVARQNIASRTDFPEGTHEVDLEVMSDVNLKDYAVAERMVVGTDVQVKRQPTFNTTLRTTVTLLVDINVPGL